MEREIPMKSQNRILATVLALVLTLCALVSCNDGGSVTDPPSQERLSAPVIRMDRGPEVTVVWSTVKDAVSYVATVNGTDLPAQTDCSLSLTEDEEYVVSVRALAAEAAYDSAPSNTIKISYGFNEDAVVLRFAAFSDLSKVVLSACMVIGRLEIFPILVLFSRRAWRRP